MIVRLISLALLVLPTLAAQNPAAPPEREADVYAIFSLLLTAPETSHGPDDNVRYLIARTTRLPIPQRPCVQPPPERRARFQEVLADFEARKTTPRVLKPQFTIPKPYELLTPEQVKEFQAAREPRPGDQLSSPRFAGVQDVFTLTDVYFSKDGRLALTAVSTWCGGLCGKQSWKVLEKLPSGKWQEQPWITCFTVASAREPRPRTRQ